MATSARASNNALSAIVVDPRGYTPPYDYALCEALGQYGCRVLLASAERREVNWKQGNSFSRWNKFYELTSEFPTDGSSTFREKVIQGFDHLLSMHRFLGLVSRERPDVIHFQWLPLPALDQGYLLMLRKRAKLVLTLHNTTLFHGAVSRWRGLGFASALKHFDALIVHTDFSKQRVLEQSWVDEAKVHVVPHGVFEHYRTLPSVEANPTSAKRLLFFGNLHPYKGVDVLLRAFAKLSDQVRQQTRLVIAGRPIMDPTPLMELSRRLGIEDRVDWILRAIAEEEVSGLFRSSTAIVLPYREIDQSGVLMTAIAFGKPIIATRVGGIPELVQDGIHGYLVPAEDPKALAAATGRLLSSEDRMRQMEEAVRDLGTGRLAWSNIARETSDLYRKLLGDQCTVHLPLIAHASQANKPALH